MATPTNEEVIILNDVSRFGLHRLHLLSGQPINLEAAIGKYVGDGQVETWLMYEEEALRLHHLRLYWKDFIPTSPNFKGHEIGGGEGRP